jgi:flagellin
MWDSMETNPHKLTFLLRNIVLLKIRRANVLFHGGIRTLALRIFNNLASYSAQRLLSDNNNKLSRIFSRIASGERIQQTSDDSAGMMTAEALKSDVRTLRQGVRNLNEALSLLNVVDGAINEEVSIVIRMRELATQAATGTIGTTERQATNLEFSAMRSDLNRIANTTEYNGIKVLDGSLSSSASNHTAIQFGLNSNDVSSVDINRTVNVTALTALNLKLNELSISSQSGAATATEALKVTLDTMTEIRGRLGSTQNRLGRTLNNTLAAAENLTAAGSVIGDADLASDFAHLKLNSRF